MPPGYFMFSDLRRQPKTRRPCHSPNDPRSILCPDVACVLTRLRRAGFLSLRSLHFLIAWQESWGILCFLTRDLDGHFESCYPVSQCPSGHFVFSDFALMVKHISESPRPQAGASKRVQVVVGRFRLNDGIQYSGGSHQPSPHLLPYEQNSQLARNFPPTTRASPLDTHAKLHWQRYF